MNSKSAHPESPQYNSAAFRLRQTLRRDLPQNITF